jgi:molybdopterin synthase catalytic subunit
VSTPHRADAFTAGRWVIDELKRRLPVWKKEHYVDGSRWLDGSSPPVPETSP